MYDLTLGVHEDLRTKRKHSTDGEGLVRTVPETGRMEAITQYVYTGLWFDAPVQRFVQRFVRTQIVRARQAATDARAHRSRVVAAARSSQRDVRRFCRGESAAGPPHSDGNRAASKGHGS